MIRVNLLPLKETQRAIGQRQQFSVAALSVSVALLLMVVPFVLQGLRLSTLAAQTEERFPLQIQQISFADKRLVRQRASCENAGEGATDHRIVIRDAPGTPREMHPKLERGRDAVAAHSYACRRNWPAVAFPRAFESKVHGVRHEPLAVHRRAIDRSEITQPSRIVRAR